MPRKALLAAVAVASVLLSGCGGSPPPSVPLPEGVTVSAFQNRFHYSLRQLELKVSNDTGAAITVTRAAFDSTRFATPAV